MSVAYRLLFAASLALSGCASLSPLPMSVDTPRVQGQTSTFQDLKSLPAPRGPIAVSVYGFRDQTGQYKPQPNVSSFSTVVTQGATSVLMQTLQESNWFIPVEREGLQNLLTERKIIRAAQAESSDAGQVDGLPSLATAQVILEGGIIGYDANLVTGGAGAAYFGVSADSQIRQDQITVHLRAVDVRSGRVLTSVTVSKTLLSRQVRTGLFRFVGFKRLAELEAGYSTNEPTQICVLQAIQKAVLSLIIQGVEDRVWALQDEAGKQSPLFQQYREEKSLSAL